MTAPLFVVPAGTLPAAASLELTGSEGRHAARVRRLRSGERVDVTDGRGWTAACRVAAALADGLELDVLEQREQPPPTPRLVVVQAIPKGDRGELAVQLLAEAGVDEVVPWPAARSVARWSGERGARSVERWRSTATEAAKQSRRGWFPVVGEPATTAEVCVRLDAAALAAVLHESADRPLADAPVPARGDVILVVGPEGGLSEEELAAFGAAGATAYRLGPTVLRTSTAGVVAAALVLARTARWS